jgi:hypothetical protein
MATPANNAAVLSNSLFLMEWSFFHGCPVRAHAWLQRETISIVRRSDADMSSFEASRADAGSLNTFDRNGIEVAPISSYFFPLHI